VQCENPSIGATPEASNPAPDSIPTILDSLIPNNGTRVPTPLSCNAILTTGLACNAPKTEHQKFCKKCTTRIRVARLRAKTAPLRALKQPIANDYLSQKRYAGAGLRDAGKYSVVVAAKQRKETVKTLRAESKKKRDELKQQIKALTPALAKAIAEADAEYDKVVAETAAILK
jgi:hypothetical protein